MNDNKKSFVIYFMCGSNYQVCKKSLTDNQMWEWVATHCGDLGSDNIRETNSYIDPEELNIIRQNPEKYFREHNGKLIADYEPVVIAIKEGDYINPEPNGDGNIIYECPDFSIADFYEEIITALVNGEISTKDLREENIKIADKLDEAKKREPKEKLHFYYEGPLYRFDEVFRREWTAETYAVSLRQAINNFKAKAKREFGFTYDSNMDIDEDRIIVVRSTKTSTGNEKTCPRCGQNILSDGGFCPWCDDGDPEFDPKNKIEEGLVNNLFGNTPYMLRKDGKLLTCGDVHPYIKMSSSYDIDKNITELLKHKDFIPWFYNNVDDNETIKLLDSFLRKAYAEGYEEAANFIKDSNITDYVSSEQLSDLLDELSNKINNEFCKVRTSNIRYKYGGDNGEIYFRIPSSLSDWFDVIWTIVFKYADYITNITVVKDSGTMSQPFNVEYCKINGKELKKFPADEFLTLGSNPVME